MSRIFVATCGIDSWRQRLASPDKQWRRFYSAFETAVSWEYASREEHGIPESIRNLFRVKDYGKVKLIQAIAEHKVALPGGRACSQCDVWATINTNKGVLSLSVEAKAKESFGKETLCQWLAAGKSKRANNNRKLRWEYISQFLPKLKYFETLRYQILHRCASAIIEAIRLNLKHAAFVVQAFNAPDSSFDHYKSFCKAAGMEAIRNSLMMAQVGEISLGIGWADCSTATDEQVATTTFNYVSGK